MISFSFSSLAEPFVYDCGVYHGYNGASWYDQAWVDCYADDYDCYMYVSINKNGNVYGLKRTTVLAYHRSTCYSYQVQGSGGGVYYYYEVLD